MALYRVAQTRQRQNVMTKSILIFDCEIIKAIPPKNDADRVPGIEYCEGWRDFENMGISVIGAYDYVEDRYRVFEGDNFDEFQDLISHHRWQVCGFNSIGFDALLCQANGLDVTTDVSRHYDILAEIWVGAGLSRQFQYPSHIGFSLDACCKANFGTKKSGIGAFAPVDWQQKRFGKVVDYCLNDIRLTKQLLDQIIAHGYIRDPRDPGRIIEVARP